MRIVFECKKNKNYCMVNTTIFHLKNGTTITIDRKCTEYGIDDNGNLEMNWSECYIWAINGRNIFGGNYAYLEDAFETLELLKDATVELELEDDAPDEDYKVEVKEVCFY